MKKSIIKYLLSVCLLALFWSCQKQKLSDEFFTEKAYVIGMDPCTKSNSDGLKGYVIKLTNSKDTVLTYNLPVEMILFIEEENPDFKESHLFTSSYSNNYPLNIVYKRANDDEKKFPLCLANIDISGISKISGKQIVIIKKADEIK